MSFGAPQVAYLYRGTNYYRYSINGGFCYTAFSVVPRYNFSPIELIKMLISTTGVNCMFQMQGIGIGQCVMIIEKLIAP